jgi:hypothetical protein
MKPGSNLFEEEMSIKVEFPYQVNIDIVKKLIKTDEKDKLMTEPTFNSIQMQSIE